MASQLSCPERKEIVPFFFLNFLSIKECLLLLASAACSHFYRLMPTAATQLCLMADAWRQRSPSIQNKCMPGEVRRTTKVKDPRPKLAAQPTFGQLLASCTIRTGPQQGLQGEWRLTANTAQQFRFSPSMYRHWTSSSSALNSAASTCQAGSSHYWPDEYADFELP